MLKNNEIKMINILSENSYSDFRKIREIFMRIKEDGKDTVVVDYDTFMCSKGFRQLLIYLKYANLNVKLELKDNDELLDMPVLNGIDIINVNFNSKDNEVQKNNIIKSIDLKNKYKHLDFQVSTMLNKDNLIDIYSIALILENGDISSWNLYRDLVDPIGINEFNFTLNLLKYCNIKTIESDYNDKSVSLCLVIDNRN